MDKLEKVEKIREKTGVSYEDAKTALEASNEDILDAIVYLENSGKVKKPGKQVYTTQRKKDEEFEKAANNYGKEDEETFGGVVKRFLSWCSKWIKKGSENFFVVRKNEEQIISLPVVVLVLLMLLAFWIVVPLIVIGLFFDFHYSFKGNITKSKTVDINRTCDKASETCENIKQEFKN